MSAGTDAQAPAEIATEAAAAGPDALKGATAHATAASRTNRIKGPPTKRATVMPRWLRQTLTVTSFVIFFVGTLCLGVVFLLALFPILLLSPQRYRALVTRTVGHGFGTFIFWMKLCRLFTYDKLQFPESLRGRPYVMVANHPSLIDVLFLLNAYPGLTSVVKGTWYRFFFFAPLLKSVNYLPAYRGAHVGAGGTPQLDAMVDHLGKGHALVCFPEGTRSAADSLRRFRRGPFEAAMRAGVPIVSVFVGVDRPLLMKGQSVFEVPDATPHYVFELREIIEPEDYADNTSEEIRRAVRDDLDRCFRSYRGLPARGDA